MHATISTISTPDNNGAAQAGASNALVELPSTVASSSTSTPPTAAPAATPSPLYVKLSPDEKKQIKMEKKFWKKLLRRDITSAAPLLVFLVRGLAEYYSEAYDSFSPLCGVLALQHDALVERIRHVQSSVVSQLALDPRYEQKLRPFVTSTAHAVAPPTALSQQQSHSPSASPVLFTNEQSHGAGGKRKTMASDGEKENPILANKAKQEANTESARRYRQKQRTAKDMKDHLIESLQGQVDISVQTIENLQEKNVELRRQLMIERNKVTNLERQHAQMESPNHLMANLGGPAQTGLVTPHALPTKPVLHAGGIRNMYKSVHASGLPLHPSGCSNQSSNMATVSGMLPHRSANLNRQLLVERAHS